MPERESNISSNISSLLKQAVLELLSLPLRSQDNDDDDDNDDRNNEHDPLRMADLCQTIRHQLKACMNGQRESESLCSNRAPPYHKDADNENENENDNHSNNNDNHTALTIRHVLAFLPQGATCQFKEFLLACMQDRVDRQALMPLTLTQTVSNSQEDDSQAANPHAAAPSTLSAVPLPTTVTRLAMCAAQLYATLLALPGAATEWTDLSTLNALAQVWDQSRRVAAVAGWSPDSSLVDDSDEHPVVSNADLAPRHLIRLSGSLAHDLCLIPAAGGGTFASTWSLDARSIVVTCLASLHATAAAWADASAAPPDWYPLDLVQRSWQALQQALVNCAHTMDSDENQDPEGVADAPQLDLIVAMYRVFKPVMLMQEQSLPLSEAGRLAAAKVCFQAVEALIQTFSAFETAPQTPIKRSSQQTSITIMSPSSCSTDCSMAITPKAGRKNRNTGKKKSMRRNLSCLTSPKLKGTDPMPACMQALPGASFAFTGATNTGPAEVTTLPPRNAWTVTVGLLQKLLSHPDLAKTKTRTLLVPWTVQCACPLLPSIDQWYVIHFVFRLSQSAMPVHRLVAVEFLGGMFGQEWFWTGCHNQTVQSNLLVGSLGASSVNTESSSTAWSSLSWHLSREPPQEELPWSTALIDCLLGCLIDRSLTVRSTCASTWGRLLLGLSEMPPPVREGLSGLLLLKWGSTLDQLLCLGAINDEATVQRACLRALVELVLLPNDDKVIIQLRDDHLQLLNELCRANSILVREAACEALTRLLETCTHTTTASVGMRVSDTDTMRLERIWTVTVVTMVLDEDQRCAKKAVGMLQRILLEPLLAQTSSNDPTDSNAVALAWRILGSLESSQQQQQEYTPIVGMSGMELSALVTGVGKLIESSLSSGSAPARKFSSLSSSTEWTYTLLSALCTMAAESLQTCSSEQLWTAEVDTKRMGVWNLLEALVSNFDHKQLAAHFDRLKNKVDWGFLTSWWQVMLDFSRAHHQEIIPETFRVNLVASMRSSLMVLTKLAPCLDSSTMKDVMTNLSKALGKFQLPPSAIQAAVETILTACLTTHPHNDPEGAVERCSAWIRDTYDSCQEELAAFVGRPLDNEAACESLGRALFIVGEISLVGFAGLDDDPKRNHQQREMKASKQPYTSGKVSAMPFLRGLSVRPSSTLLQMVQAFQAPTLPGNANRSTPTSIRAHAFFAFGRLCLRDETLAKKSVHVFARELASQPDHNDVDSWAVHSNTLVILSDLCMKYTNLVDKYLPAMAACLQAGLTDLSSVMSDTNAESNAVIVRKHAVVILSELLLQDYVKWRGLLFHRYLVATTDDDDDVADFAKIALCGPLLAKQPKLFVNQFVESLFVLNCCTAHPIYLAASSTGDGGSGILVGFDGIRLVGELGRARRMNMYNLMLQRLQTVEKIDVTARITKDVLGSTLREGSDLYRACTAKDRSLSEAEENAFEVLSDALDVLSSPYIRVASTASADPSEDDNMDDPDSASTKSGSTAATKISAATGRLYANISRKHLIEVVLPILCDLKALLQVHRCRLVKKVMDLLVNIYERYKAEVCDILANKPMLLAEIAYDANCLSKQRIPELVTGYAKDITSWVMN